VERRGGGGGIKRGGGGAIYMLNTRKEEQKYRILFTFSLVYEYTNLAYVRIYVLYRVKQAEYSIRVLMAAPQEYVNTFSTRSYPAPTTVTK